MDRWDSRMIFWGDSRGYQNDRTRYGRSYVPDRWVPSYRSQQKHFMSYSQGRRSSGDERNEDQRRIRRSESPIEKHNRWSNPDQYWSMGAYSIDDYQEEHNKEDHPWTDSEKTRSKEPSKKQPQKEEGAGSWGLIGKERLRKDCKRTRSKGLPREEQLGENSKRMVSEDPPEEELQRQCNKKARSRELAGKEQPQDDITQEESREGNEKEQQKEGLKRTRPTELDKNKQLKEHSKRVKSSEQTEGGQPKEKSGKAVHRMTTQEEQPNGSPNIQGPSSNKLDQGLGLGQEQTVRRGTTQRGMELRKEDIPEKTTQSSSEKRDIEGYTAIEIRVPTGQTEGKILGEVIEEEDRLEMPDTELRYNAILKGADVDWELHGIGCDPSCQGEENGNCHAYSASTISARGSQCNSVSSTDSIQSTDKWHTTNPMVIHTSQGLQKVDRAESTSRSECGDMEMMVKGLIPTPYW